MANKISSATKVVIPCRISFANIFEPKSINGGEAMLNLHATFTKGTIEFRLFQFADPADGKRNGLHAGEMKAYIQLCLAMSQLAKMVRTASPKPQQTDNEKYAMRCWMLRLGFIGDEFATAREILLRNMEGNASWRNK